MYADQEPKKPFDKRLITEEGDTEGLGSSLVDLVENNTKSIELLAARFDRFMDMYRSNIPETAVDTGLVHPTNENEAFYYVPTNKMIELLEQVRINEAKITRLEDRLPPVAVRAFMIYQIAREANIQYSFVYRALYPQSQLPESFIDTVTVAYTFNRAAYERLQAEMDRAAAENGTLPETNKYLLQIEKASKLPTFPLLNVLCRHLNGEDLWPHTVQELQGLYRTMYEKLLRAITRRHKIGDSEIIDQFLRFIEREDVPVLLRIPAALSFLHHFNPFGEAGISFNCTLATLQVHKALGSNFSFPMATALYDTYLEEAKGGKEKTASLGAYIDSLCTLPKTDRGYSLTSAIEAWLHILIRHQERTYERLVESEARFNQVRYRLAQASWHPDELTLLLADAFFEISCFVQTYRFELTRQEAVDYLFLFTEQYHDKPPSLYLVRKALDMLWSQKILFDPYAPAPDQLGHPARYQLAPDYMDTWNE